MTTPTRTYPRTDRAKVFNFVESLAPTPEEAPYLASVFSKNSLSMKDCKTLCDFIARRASEMPLERDAIATLGLPSLPQNNAPAARTASVV
jgi:hypothetical protein